MAPAHPTHVSVVDDDPAVRAGPALPATNSDIGPVPAGDDAEATARSDRNDPGLDRINVGYAMKMAGLC